MTSTKKLGFWPLPLPTWAGHPSWTSTWGRHEIHIALLKRIVQWSSGPKAEIRLYDCNLFKTVLLVIYITDLYHRKFSTFYSIERRNSGKKDTNFFAWEEDRMTSVDYNFNFLCGRPHGSWPLPIHMRPPEPDPSPLRVDVINGWPLCLQPSFFVSVEENQVGLFKWPQL